MRFTSLARVVLSTAALTSLGCLVACNNAPAGNDGGNTTDVVQNADATTDTSVADSSPSTDAQVEAAAPDVQNVPNAGSDAAGGDGMSAACHVSPDVATYVTQMSTTGWSSRNRAASMLMYGCGPTDTPSTCLSTAPLTSATDIGATASVVPGAHLRVLYTATTASAYWTRISADGRFVARGTHVHDMTRDAEITAVHAEYDPAFFPDNSRFIYQPGGFSCPMSMLTTGMPTSVTINAAPCVGTMVGLYEHLGVSLDGGDYWATSAGAAGWDDGGHSPTLTDPPPNSPWTASAQVTLSLMANTGTTFASVAQVSVRTPFQGDAVLSPSTHLLMTRLVDTDGVTMLGYVLNRLNPTRTGSAISTSLSELARYCVQGAKPAFSLDEHFVVMHHYVTDDDATDLGFASAEDAGFQTYRALGASNIYLLDLVTGHRTRITNMAAGQYALYPAFRSDNWIYFNVRSLNAMGHALTTEHVIASDAALVLQ